VRQAFSRNLGLPPVSITTPMLHIPFIHSLSHPSINYVTEVYQPPIIKNTLVTEVLNLSVLESQKFRNQLGNYKLPKQSTAS
jgi:hypothetical protein